MLFSYVAVHHEPTPAAPDITTVVSPHEHDDETVKRLVKSRSDVDVARVVKYDLTAQVQSEHPRIAMEEVFARYVGTGRGCARCHLCTSRTRVVFIKGNVESPILAVGEGPGKTEDGDGVPFVGRAGRLQSQIFREVDIDPDGDIAWTNLCACRPCTSQWAMEDRPPSVVERLACSERLMMTFQAIRPRVILCLGDHATSLFWDSPPPRNTWHFFGEGSDRILVGVMRHPSYLVRSMEKNYKEYFSEKMFLRRLRLNIGKLKKVSRWTLAPRYVQKALEDGSPIVGGREGDRRR